MSETNTTPAPGEAAPAPEYKPTETLSNEPEGDEAPVAEAAPEGEEKPAEAKPEKTPEEKARERDNRRYAQQTAARHREAARAEAAERRATELEERLRKLENPGQPNAPKPPDIDKMVAERAEQMLAQREATAKIEAFDKAGSTEFGQDEFRERCNTVAAMANDKQRSTMLEVLIDMDGGHRAVAALADDPEEAQRILAMPAHRMALAMAKLADAPAAAPRPAAVSRAPEPIRPVTGRANREPDPNGSMDEYVKWSAKQKWTREQRT